VKGGFCERVSDLQLMDSFETKATDTRPLKDAAFRNKCLQKVILYLVSHNYDSQLSPKVHPQLLNCCSLEVEVGGRD
jgi:SMC interacting uncharacterized protein involved in chromosome segregation